MHPFAAWLGCHDKRAQGQVRQALGVSGDDGGHGTQRHPHRHHGAARRQLHVHDGSLPSTVGQRNSRRAVGSGDRILLRADYAALPHGRRKKSGRAHPARQAEPVLRDAAAAHRRTDGAGIHQRHLHRLRFPGNYDHCGLLADYRPHQRAHAGGRHPLHDYEPGGLRSVPARHHPAV